MKHNPFTSATYIAVWSKHFNKAKAPISFEFIENIRFVKHWLLPLHINVGKNLTKGIDYKLNHSAKDYKGKTFLIYDVPTYFDVEPFSPKPNDSLRLKKMYQYQGFLMDISSYENVDEYINSQFSSKNRREFRSNQRRLETCFDISYEFIHGETSKEKFDLIFKQFYDLLSKRFSDKQTNYHHLNPNKWNFYEELVFKMLQEKKSSLLIIYNDNQPIGITLNFHSEDILFETITVFDPDYYKFNIGKLTIVKIIEWCYENTMAIADFSKGDFDFKHEWCNVVYDFNYHLLYDSKSLISKILAYKITLFFKFKLYLRNHHVNALYRKLLFKLNTKNDEAYNTNFVAEDIDNFKVDTTFDEIDLDDDKVDYIKNFVYSFLFANPEPLKAIKVYKKKTSKTFMIVGSQKAQRITFN
ncbi:MAG: GNAT family N-acetyltransferase [Gelidibacter sp.]|nr:GNAT family N-acetyltransferase [Gelidibacter sp.]